MNPKKICIFASVMVFFAANLFASSNVELDEAIGYFNNGRFQRAVDLLERLLVAKTLAQDDYQLANEYLAVAYLSKDEAARARGLFTEVLKKSPDYRPSDRWWPHQRFMAEYFKAQKEFGESPEATTQGPGIKTIAIMDFENNSVENFDKYKNLGNALAKIVISDFAVLSQLKVVERERLQYILDELELTAKTVGGAGVVDQASAPRIGKLLGAHTFVFGSFIQVDKTFRIDASLVKTETSEILKTFSVEGKPDKLFDLAKKLTLKITQGLDVELEKAEHKELDKLGKQDIPIEAVALFGDAMSKANQEKYADALNSLEQALAHAPNFSKAQQMRDVLKPLALAGKS